MHVLSFGHFEANLMPLAVGAGEESVVEVSSILRFPEIYRPGIFYVSVDLI